MAKKILLVILLILCVLGIGLTSAFFSLKHRYYSSLSSRDGQTNILILGFNGKGGADADLTDSIIILSLDTPGRKAALISLPRDLWIESLKAKINTAYHYGGVPLARQSVTEVTGLPIDYHVLVNFDGFKDIIDLLGGVTIDVKNSFDDFKYPIAGKEADPCDGDPQYLCRFEHLHFAAGQQTMDGATALKYVRSRNAEGEEGTDFARSERQSNLLSAVSRQVISTRFILHPRQAIAVARSALTMIETDISENQYANFAHLAATVDWSAMQHLTINGGFLDHPKSHYSKQWVLVPKSGDWQEIQAFLKKELTD